jgi:hypothetical protein
MGIVNVRQPERYVRINITKQAKGYVYETTVSLRWDDQETNENADSELCRLSEMADFEARGEIARREALDAEKVSAGA